MSGKKWSRSRRRAFARRIKQLWQSPAYQRKMAARPVNRGGHGIKGQRVTVETRAKISATKRAQRRRNPQQAQYMRKQWAKPGYREKMAAAHSGQPAGPHWAALIERQHGRNHPRWKGGVTIKAGYRFVWRDGKQVREHRMLMERKLGRRLRRSEVVHHKNGNKLDNRLANLELMRSRHGAR